MSKELPPQSHWTPDKLLQELSDWGFTPVLLQSYLQTGMEQLLPGRIISIYKDQCDLLTPLGTVRGIINRRLSSKPVTGDWAVFPPATQDCVLIKNLLPRTTLLERRAPGKDQTAQPLAANFDLVLLLFSAELPFRPAKLHRFTAAVRNSGAPCVIVFSKADLNPTADQYVKAARAHLPDIPAFHISAKTGAGIAELQRFLSTYNTTVLLGSSGSGKSTLINTLSGKELLATGEVREKDKRGKHTTTNRMLLRTPSGLCLIDTPGIRELSVFLDEGEIQSAFPEIEQLAADCKFRDCTHIAEPDCRVLEALAGGELPQELYRQYLKLKAEARSLQIRNDPKLLREEERRWTKLRKEGGYCRKKKRS